MSERHTVLLGDTFSLEEEGYFGRAIANRSLLKALFLCDRVERILSTGPENLFRKLEVQSEVNEKLIVLGSLNELINSMQQYSISAIFCSDFIAGYPDWIDFRNRQGLECPVYGWTHSLSYQRYTADIFKILTAGPTEKDGILCTSPSAVTAVGNMVVKTRAALKSLPTGPTRFLFPLAYEVPDQKPMQFVKPEHPFQVLILGRLDWQTKADLLVLSSIIRQLPDQRAIRFVVAGAGDNQAYIKLLRQVLTPLGVDIRISISEAEKEQLYRQSQVLFLPADNYQETFGLSVLEAKHYGCVPVVADWNGFRSLVVNQRDGILLPTVAAPIPDELYQAQNIVSEATYHGWWAAGISIDPGQAAKILWHLYNNRVHWQQLSRAAIDSVACYSPAATGERFSRLLADEIKPIKPGLDAISTSDYPGHWNLLELFSGHATEVWENQVTGLTTAGEDYLMAPYSLPQMALLMKTIDSEMIVRFLRLVQETGAIMVCLNAGIHPLVMSLALKNGLIFLKNTKSI